MEQTFENKTLSKFDESPVIQEIESFIDADDELMPIAEYIKQTTVHNSDKEVNRIKFLYTNKPRKDGGRYVIMTLIQRSDMEKMINDEYDFIITVFYDAWKELKGEQKVIQVDKVLCGIDMGDMESQKISKKTPDSREYIENMNHFTPKKVMEVSEIIHMTCQRITDEKKEEKKKQKETKQ